jgi:hypothetical protein
MSRPAPRTPNRQRILRPDFWRDGATGRLRGAERDAYLGLATLTDDEGSTLWQPETIAALLFPYEAVEAREAMLVEYASALVYAELLIVLECACACLPRVKEDLGFKGGSHSSTVRDYHESQHPESVQVRTSLDKSLSFVASSFVASSLEGKRQGEGVGGGSAEANGPDKPKVGSTDSSRNGRADDRAVTAGQTPGRTAGQKANGPGQPEIESTDDVVTTSSGQRDTGAEKGHDVKFERRKQSAIDGIVGGEIYEGLVPELIRTYGITDAELAAARAARKAEQEKAP